MYRDVWTDRQVILAEAGFEFHHYLDAEAPRVEFHQHPFYELLIFLGGDADYTIEGKTYRLCPGDVLLTNRLDIHRPELRPGVPYERVVIWLEDSFFAQLRAGGDDLAACFADAARKNYRRVRPEPARFSRMRALCDDISRDLHERALGSYALACARLFELLVEVCRCYYDAPDDGRDVTEDEKVNAVLAYINAHIADTLTLDAIAEHFYISKFHLSHQFRRFTGMSIYQYIVKKRVTIARDLLLGGVPATQACHACGFGDYSNFLKAFKREFHQYPRYFTRPAARGTGSPIP